MTYEEVTKTLNDNGWTTREGKKFYGTYVHNMEKRLGKRQKLINRYKRTIVDIRVEFHYDEKKEKGISLNQPVSGVTVPDALKEFTEVLTAMHKLA